MTQTQNPAAVALVLRRTFDAKREAVFQAWTDPAVMRKFFGSKGCNDVQVDLRVGGAFRIAMITSTDEEFVAVGIYREVEIPSRVVCTWRWLEDDPADEHESLLTLEFNELGSQTELVLSHENLRDAESREGHARGWGSMLDGCAGVLA